MEANDFIARLKADGSEKDLCNLQEVYDDYKVILMNLGAKDKGAFSLNVLCILCRNLDKIPSWRDKVDGKILITLSIECVRETRGLQRPDQVKVLACIYHVHKHAVKLTSSIPPELIFKLSCMPFECDSKSFLQEYSKTYWNILVDRISYIEKLKTKFSISRLLPRLSEDVLKVIQIYDSVQFCKNILTFLVKKLHFLYNDVNATVLHQCFGDIFKSLSSKSDLASFKKLSDKEMIEIYMKFNECFYVIAENSSKTKFESFLLNVVVRTAITILGHNIEVTSCLETFFLNGFCSIFENLMNATNIENVLNNMVASSQSIENLGYAKAIYATYPFINQFLRLFIEYTQSNTKLDWNLYFNNKIQTGCLNLMLYLSTKKSEQFLKCENCKVKTGLHDSLRLLFLIKHFPVTAISQKLDISSYLPIYYKLVTVQHKILYELKRLGCPNHNKCFRKLQTDIHNTAIALNKANYYDYSIKMFNFYIEMEMRYFKDGDDLKCISRALYNKGICELDNKLYLDALQDGYLSLIFSLPDGLNTEKYMSLVMDVKAKAKGDQDDFQSTSILDICKNCVETKKYGNLKPFFVNLKFSAILKHEFEMYAKMWPSILPIGGVWKALYELTKEKPAWLLTKDDDVLSILFEVIIQTCTVVRTIHNEMYTEVVVNLLEILDNNLEEIDLAGKEFAYAALLVLQFEYDMAETSRKYQWKSTEPTTDPDQVQATRTMVQEHEASKRAIQAVHILKQAVKVIKSVGTPPWFHNAQLLYSICALQLLQLTRTVPALQLCALCCVVASTLGDSESFVRNASLLLSHASASSAEMKRLALDCSARCGDVAMQTALCAMCDTALYYSKIGSKGLAARLIHIVQGKILEAYQTNEDVNLDLAIGRLAEAQAHLCGSYNELSVASGIQRHYLAITNTETQWSSRRILALTLKHHIVASSISATDLCGSLLLYRRARCTANACLNVACGAALGRLHAAACDARRDAPHVTKVADRLKHVLGLQPNDESKVLKSETSKPELFTPRHENLETMLEDHVFKKTQLSPSLSCVSVYGYKLPDFFKHDSCDCAPCDNPISFIIACKASGLESSMYYRAKETEIARNYFDGTVKSFTYAECKIKSYFQRCRREYDSYIVDIVEKMIFDDFNKVQIEILIEMAFFELSNGSYEKTDDAIVRIHEILQEMTSPNPYLRNDVMNLMMASAKIRKAVVKPVEIGLELEMESLKLSPYKEPPKTPTNQRSPPKIPKNIVSNEELPIVKRKVIKLNLDDPPEEKVTRKTRKRAEFKIPVPVTSKPVLECITPRIPNILVRQPSENAVNMTPNCDEDFFTPKSTPADQFFTPMTSIKTYSKKSLRSNIVKNLEAEFSTPKSDKENSTLNTEPTELPKTSGRSVSSRSKVDKRILKRATSPGKLPKEVKTTRSKLKTPINFKIHEDNGK